MYIILAILAFGVLIFVHELGHFALAKINGVRVEEFSIGMGPKIFSKQGKETKYSIGLFPIGGYVSMMGEEQAVDDERSFSEKSFQELFTDFYEKERGVKPEEDLLELLLNIVKEEGDEENETN